jgi:hypothetical protein
MKNFYQFNFLVLFVLLAGCGSKKPSLLDSGVGKATVIHMICGAEIEEICLSKLCENTAKCAVIEALSNETVFDFVTTYAECQDCNTPTFPLERGIGKCVEYQVSQNPTEWTIAFWVSENCSFRYGNPSDSRIMVKLETETLKIKSIDPPVEYLKDPLYCQAPADCLLLSGSGISVVGCSNYFYAPLNWSGYDPNQNCACIANQCSQK